MFVTASKVTMLFVQFLYLVMSNLLIETQIVLAAFRASLVNVVIIYAHLKNSMKTMD